MIENGNDTGKATSLESRKTLLVRHRWTRFVLVLALALLTQRAQAQDWWTMSSAQFAQQFAQQATSNTLTDQSMVAWMLFARVNQQTNFDNKTVSAWELWPSNEDTFSPAVRAFAADNKVRTRPHLQAPKILRLQRHLELPPQSGGEEVVRNMLSYDYIVGNGLNTKVGVFRYLSSPNAKVDLPVGAVEIKADWSTDAVAGAYQFTDTSTNPPTTYSLLGLHIMAKMAAAPADPFHSEDPSWLWTTFEFKGNPGLANAQSLITYKDALSSEQAMELLSMAGLGDTAFTNYVCNGTQIRYSDAQNPAIILGNTLMENFAGEPAGPPQRWKTWNSSCHTCHGTASGDAESRSFYPFEVLTGKLQNTNPSLDPYTSLDFIWSIPFHAR